MIYPSILDRKYNQHEPFVQEVAKRVKETLLNFCDTKGYAFTSRIKTIESLAEKIETGRFKKWSDLDDLFACTIIIPSLSHEKEVTEFCKNTFEIIKIIKRGQNKKSPDTFRFDSTRIYTQIKNNNAITQGNELSIYQIKFEIQIKSAFEHAWSVSTHNLVYKNSEIDWRKLRLAAQIKATVEQLDMLILAFEQTSEFIDNNDYSEIKTKQNLVTEINKLFRNNQLPDELEPKDMSRFCDNLYRLLIKVVDEKKIKTVVKQIIQKIQSTKLNQIPRSISLFQYFITILISEEIINTPIEGYYWHVTQEVISLYPALRNIGSTFEYEENAQ
jgi:ppGpp synthetase/RelA/SpoT-type nucleotidyltranferase